MSRGVSARSNRPCSSYRREALADWTPSGSLPAGVEILPLAECGTEWLLRRVHNEAAVGSPGFRPARPVRVLKHDPSAPALFAPKAQVRKTVAAPGPGAAWLHVITVARAGAHFHRHCARPCLYPLPSLSKRLSVAYEKRHFSSVRISLCRDGQSRSVSRTTGKWTLGEADQP
jgi:hypothetical protein